MPSTDPRQPDVRLETIDSRRFRGAPPTDLAGRRARLEMRTVRERTIGEVAGAQHRVIATWQLNALGFDDSAIARRAGTGSLHRIHRGVYAVGLAKLDRSGWWMAGVLAAGPGTALSHQSGAGLHRLRPGSGPVHVTVTKQGGGRHRAGLVIHTARRLAPADVTVLDAIPVTTVARTLLDLGATLKADHLARALVRAEQNRTLDVQAIDAAVARAPGHRGTARLRAALARHRPDAHRTESELQHALLALIDIHQIPRPELEVQLTPEDRVDFLWRNEKLVVETDGFRAHGTRTAFEHDRQRDRRLHALGYTVLRYTYKDVAETPHAAAADLLSFLTGSATML